VEDILKIIVKQKRADLVRTKKLVPIDLLKLLMRKAHAPLDFKKALSGGSLKIIAEVKKASPSKGILSVDFKPVKIARIFEASGAAALSVLTEEKFFQGSLLYLNNIKKAVKLPLLRKDFIIDEYQLYESRAAGADAVLLIVSCLSARKLKRFLSVINNLGMHALVEAHSKAEAIKAVNCGAGIIGINNRDLKTFKTNLKTTAAVIKVIPQSKIVVSESGIFTHADAEFVKNTGADAILVGEALMTAVSIKKTLKDLSC